MRQVTANVQAIGRTAQTSFAQVKTSADSATRSLQAMHQQASTVGATMGRVFSALGVGVSVGAIAQKFAQVSKEVINLSYSMREVGMSERWVRAFMNAAEEAGVSAESMGETLKNVRREMEGLNFAGSEFRAGLIQQVGGGRELARTLMSIPKAVATAPSSFGKH
jgi:hypothetical protein